MEITSRIFIWFCFFYQLTFSDSATQPPPPPRPSFQSDPIDMSPVHYPNADHDIRETIQRHWRQIRTRQSRNNRVQDWYNFRLTHDGHQRFPEYLQQILTDQSTVFKINLSFGYILRNNETDELTYYHASANNYRLFDEPYLITNPINLQQLIDDLSNTDFIEWIKQQRPNSKWIVDWVTNVTFFVTKVRGHPIGKATLLPNYVLLNQAIVALECDSNTGKPYNDWLCFFRCLAVHNGGHLKNLKRDTEHYFEQ